MTIAIHINASKSGNIRESFNFKCFAKIAAEQPAHHFIYIFDSRPDPELYLDPNCTPVIESPVLRNNLLRHYWYNYKIPAILDRYNADVFVSSGNFCSLRTSVPQCMTIDHALPNGKTRRIENKFFTRYLTKASAICIAAPVIPEEFTSANKKLINIFSAVEYKTQTTFEQNAAIKERYTDGKDFFICEITGSNLGFLKTVLKNFSSFKKWQKTNMQLVLLLKTDPGPSLTKELVSYKYRNDLKIITNDKEEDQLISSAYGVIAVKEDSISSTGYKAIMAGVSLITAGCPVNRFLFSAASFNAELNETDIAAKMMAIYKDENLRINFIHKGKELAKRYSWENTTAEVWNTISRIAKQ